MCANKTKHFTFLYIGEKKSSRCSRGSKEAAGETSYDADVEEATEGEQQNTATLTAWSTIYLSFDFDEETVDHAYTNGEPKCLSEEQRKYCGDFLEQMLRKAVAASSDSRMHLKQVSIDGVQFRSLVGVAVVGFKVIMYMVSINKSV